MPWEGPAPLPRFLSREQLALAYREAAQKHPDQFFRTLAQTRLDVLGRSEVDTIRDGLILRRENPL